MQKTKTERTSNIELFRIILIISIIAHHYIVNSGITSQYDWSDVTINMFFAQNYGMFGKMAINGFTLITGYFMIHSNITLKKFLKTYFEAKFYYVLFYLVFLITGYTTFDWEIFLKTVVFSFIYEAGRRYVGTYLVFFLFIPFLNVFIKGCSKKQLQILIVLLLFYYTVIPTLFAWETFDFFSWFFVMYIIGAYLALYPIKLFESKKITALVFFGSIIIAILWILKVDLIDAKNGWYGFYWLMIDCNRILAVIMAIFGFLFFKSINIKYSPLINRIAASTFGVLLIHANSDIMRAFLWGDLLKNKEWYNTRYFIPHAIFSVIGVYVICLFIDQIRIGLSKIICSWVKYRQEAKNGK